MNQILTDAEITLIIRECARGSAINRDGSTSHRIARAIEQAILNKLSEQEPVAWVRYDDNGYLTGLFEQYSEGRQPLHAIKPFPFKGE